MNACFWGISTQIGAFSFQSETRFPPNRMGELPAMLLISLSHKFSKNEMSQERSLMSLWRTMPKAPGLVDAPCVKGGAIGLAASS